MSDSVTTALIPIIIASIVGAITALAVEKYKSTLETRSEYHKSQLGVYQELWHSLYDLKLTADHLWNDPNVSTLKEFVEQLQKTENTINHNVLLFEETHRDQLKKLIEIFWNFHFGKTRLIGSLKNEAYYDFLSIKRIEREIKQNRDYKEQYDQVIGVIEHSFRKQLKSS